MCVLHNPQQQQKNNFHTASFNVGGGLFVQC